MNQPAKVTHSTNRAFYDRISRAYDAIADAHEHSARERGESLLNPAPGETILEIGFGTGNSLVNLAKHVHPGGMIYGIDVSVGMYDVAQAKVDRIGWTDSVKLKTGDAVKLDYEDEMFDGAFLSFTLELFDESDVDLVLQQVKRVLKPEGRLGIVGMSTPKNGETDSRLEKTYQWLHQHFPHIVDCRPMDFDAVLSRNGFEITEEERMAIWTMPVAALTAKKAS